MLNPLFTYRGSCVFKSENSISVALAFLLRLEEWKGVDVGKDHVQRLSPRKRLRVAEVVVEECLWEQVGEEGNTSTQKLKPGR